MSLTNLEHALYGHGVGCVRGGGGGGGGLSPNGRLAGHRFQSRERVDEQCRLSTI